MWVFPRLSRWMKTLPRADGEDIYALPSKYLRVRKILDSLTIPGDRRILSQILRMCWVQDNCSADIQNNLRYQSNSMKNSSTLFNYMIQHTIDHNSASIVHIFRSISSVTLFFDDVQKLWSIETVSKAKILKNVMRQKLNNNSIIDPWRDYELFPASLLKT